MSKKKILIIEDESTCVKLVDLVINKEKVDMIVATDGEMGIQKAILEKPRLIFLDLMLPKINGYDVLKRLKEDQNLAAIPVIVVSARAGEKGKQAALEAGCEEFISKPFKVGQIKDVVERFLK